MCTPIFDRIIEIIRSKLSNAKKVKRGLKLSVPYHSNTKNYPVTWININIPDALDRSMQVFDNRGTLVKTFNRHFDAGQNRFSLRLEDIPAGQYFVKLQIGERHEYRRLVVQ